MKKPLTMMLASLTTVTLTLTGCGTTPYKSPDIHGNATLDFSSANHIVSYMFYANGNDCTGNFSLTEDQDPLRGKTNKLVLNANQRTGFNFIFMRNSKFCQITVSFIPEPDGRYGLVADADNDECRLMLIDQKNKNLPVGPSVDLKRMKYVMGWGIRNKCVPMDNEGLSPS